MALKKVVYTSLVGKYDDFKDPKFILKGWDYICFSNNLRQEDFSVWRIKPIVYKAKSKARLSRYAKLNPHIVLPEYDISLYMDANIQIKNEALGNRLHKLIEDQVLISIPLHPSRNCIYDEAEACMEAGFDSRKMIVAQVNYLKSENFPTNQGLFENNIIFRFHNHHKIVQLSEMWWEMYCRYSKRDQLSLSYLLWKNSIKCAPLFKERIDVRNSSDFVYTMHSKSFFVRLRDKINKYL